MRDLLYPCPNCTTIYEIVRHHVRPPAEPLCQICQRALPVADGDDWLSLFVDENGGGPGVRLKKRQQKKRPADAALGTAVLLHL